MASRREADEWIEAGWVRVDGKLAVLGQRVTPEAKIEIDPAAHKQQAQRVTILLNKPIGYVSGQAEDGYEPASVLIKTDTHWEDDASGLKYHIGHSRGPGAGRSPGHRFHRPLGADAGRPHRQGPDRRGLAGREGIPGAGRVRGLAW